MRQLSRTPRSQRISNHLDSFNPDCSVQADLHIVMGNSVSTAGAPDSNFTVVSAPHKAGKIFNGAPGENRQALPLTRGTGLGGYSPWADFANTVYDLTGRGTAMMTMGKALSYGANTKGPTQRHFDPRNFSTSMLGPIEIDGYDRSTLLPASFDLVEKTPGFTINERNAWFLGSEGEGESMIDGLLDEAGFNAWAVALLDHMQVNWGCTRLFLQYPMHRGLTTQEVADNLLDIDNVRVRNAMDALEAINPNIHIVNKWMGDYYWLEEGGNEYNTITLTAGNRIVQGTYTFDGNHPGDDTQRAAGVESAYVYAGIVGSL